MTNSVVVEIAQFKVKAGMSDADVLRASQEAHDGFLVTHQGYRSRELLKSDDGWWVDIVHWASMEDAQVAMKNFMGHPSTAKFLAVIDSTSVTMRHARVANVY